MTAAITRPAERFPLRQDSRLTHPLMHYSPIIVEPVLLALHVPWQTGSALNNPAPVIAVDNSVPSGQSLDYAELGGKLTVCVLCYGNYFQSHKACLDSILKTIPRERIDLRIACNACTAQTMAFARDLEPTALYTNESNKFKYPAMRQMFWDPAHPLTTRYVAWFDDNVWVKHLNWVNVLADDIHRQKADVGAYGPRVYRSFKLHNEKDPRVWFKKAGWYKNLSFRSRHGGGIPNGDTIHFCSDWFFVISTEAIKRCDIPDARLLQKGGDVVIGEQLYQNGYTIKDFNSAKNLVYTPPDGQGLKRGQKERLPWQ